MSKIKSIKINKKILPYATSIENENKNTQNMIQNIYERYPSEDNSNNRLYAEEKLFNFRYVPLSYIISNGSYVRYIDLRNPYNATLSSGGFVICDNGHNIILKKARDTGTVSLQRRRYALFLQLTTDDQLRSLLG